MSGRAETVLRCRGLAKRFGEAIAVSDLDLCVDAGEVVALIGLNGAGKTTLMRLVLAMTRPDAGTASIFGHDVITASSQQWRGVGQMIETPFAYPDLTVAENLWAAARLHGLTRSQAPVAVRDIIGSLHLRAYSDQRCSTLSQGNKQRLGLASALIHSPRLLVLDEPTSALDPAGVVLLRDLVREAAEAGAAILVSSHHLDEVARVADRVEVMHGGRLVGELPPHGIDLERAFFEMVYAVDREAARPQPSAEHLDEVG